VSVPPEAFFAIPPVLLVVGGPMLAEVGDDREPITRAAILAGGMIASGYLLPFLIGGVLMDALSTGVSIPLQYPTLVGGLYAVVFGGIGWYLGASLRPFESAFS